MSNIPCHNQTLESVKNNANKTIKKKAFIGIKTIEIYFAQGPFD